LPQQSGGGVDDDDDDDEDKKKEEEVRRSFYACNTEARSSPTSTSIMAAGDKGSLCSSANGNGSASCACRTACARNMPLSMPGGSDGRYHIVDERVLFRGWRNVVGRTVRYPSGNLVEFHVVSQSVSDEAVVVVAFDRVRRTFTLVREYMPSRLGLVLGMAAGMVEEGSHNDGINGENGFAPASADDDTVLASAIRELAEECRLDGSAAAAESEATAEWIRLTSPAHGTVMDKYCTTRLHAYLVIGARPLPEEKDDLHHHPHPHRRDDAEEGMEVVQGITEEQLLDLIQRGDLTVVGSWAALLALQKLRVMKEL
jgi:8-oxo-dGTP pyrophosphatase MutT (NUDIX family)